MRRWLCLAIFLSCLVISSKTEARNNIHYITGRAIFHEFNPTDTTAAADTLKPRKHKLVAALLAFPLPCGLLGLHRAYLGSSAAVQLAYIATLGGSVGILPFIDFVLIVINKDVNSYAHNTRLFMWSKQKKK
ncbi:MAG: hypothetical protein ACLQQ4_15295 [Bacteroidia bacterium]